MAELKNLFVTRLYRAELALKKLQREIHEACLITAEADVAGQRWSAANNYPGYTSYASLNDLPWRYPCFADLAAELDKNALAFSRKLEWVYKTPPPPRIVPGSMFFHPAAIPPTTFPPLPLYLAPNLLAFRKALPPPK